MPTRPMWTHGVTALTFSSREEAGRRDDDHRPLPEIVRELANEPVVTAQEAYLLSSEGTDGRAAAAREAQLPLKPGVILS